MGRFTEVAAGLRALEVSEERELAGRIAGLLYVTAAVTVLLLLFVPGTPIDSEAAVLATSGFSVAWGLTCMVAIPWDRVHPLISHFSSAMGLPLTAVAMAATGGADSPARFYLLFIVVYAAYFYPPREAVPHLVGCVAVLLLPLAYDPNAIDEGLLAETLILAPSFLLLGGAIMAGKQIMLTISTHDPLTGLVNRRAFEQRLGDSVDGRGGGDGFGLMLCDLDAFKLVNDQHGHPEGDRVLRAASTALQATVRSGDVVARVGGDEFAIVVAGADERAMDALAARVRSELQAASERLGLAGFELEASLGWALFPDDTTCPDELIVLADRALRERKRTIGARPRARAVLASRGWDG